MEELIFAVAVSLFLGLITGMIASSKGRSFGEWWFYGFAMFIIALPCSLFLKDKSGKQCLDCREWVAKEATVCRFCQSKFNY